MNPDRQQMIEYLRAPAGGLWRWAENGAVLVWRDGSTIAFREEIVQILDWLKPNGLPSFGAIVLLLAACRNKAITTEDILTKTTVSLPEKAGSRADLLLSARKQLQVQLEAALDQLRSVSNLPTELTSGIKARCILAEAVFEPAKAERHVEASAVLRGLQEPASDSDLLDSGSSGASERLIRQVHIVAEGLKRQTAESLALRMHTGLDALPKEIDADLPTAERARQLIEELSRDKEFGAVARAARNLMAAVRLPRRLGNRDELAIGGVADLTNRGPLDRLMLSELAHDDLTLSVRVALNEALYLRREPPMREPPGTLALLLDSGVRLWGMPRVLATAVALALIARDRQHSQVLAWRAHRKQLQPVDLLSRNGLIQHLGMLETDAHPGECLAAFMEAVSSGGENQTVLITHRDTLADPEFRRTLSDLSSAAGFVAAVDRQGRFELHALPLAHRQTVCEADLDLRTIFDERAGVSPVRSKPDSNLPAIFGVMPFPFLLPIAGRVDFWFKAGDGNTYAVVNEQQLVRFRDAGSGLRVLESNLTGGRTIWMGSDGDTVHIVKSTASQRPARLLSFPLSESQLLLLPEARMRVVEMVSGDEVKAVHRHGDVILLIRDSDVRAHALGDGRMLVRILNPHRWMNGRYFRGQNHFYFVVWDGTNIRFESLPLPAKTAPAEVTMIFDREGTEGPWLLNRQGELISTDTGQSIKLVSPVNMILDFNSVQVSKSGRRLFAPRYSKAVLKEGVGRLFDLSTQQSYIARRLPQGELVEAPALPVRNLFRSFEFIARVKDGIVLVGRKGSLRKLSLSPQDNLVIADLPEHERGDMTGKIPFSSPNAPAYRGICTFQTAEWPSGSKAFLDSRGLLHLKSHDPSIPEISLVLADGEVAGWTSDGHVCGPKFFFEGVQISEPVRIFGAIMQFIGQQ
ncbi:MAG TPA: hypothetical protein VK742_09090 [Candidatus Sulfotelmatobacter sp.]|jgi:hypothetical protein|nr:hypothetical protein [Candidatus Sulfotelmatobacter sp.]